VLLFLAGAAVLAPPPDLLLAITVRQQARFLPALQSPRVRVWGHCWKGRLLGGALRVWVEEQIEVSWS